MAVLRELAAAPGCVSIGECGLLNFWRFSGRDAELIFLGDPPAASQMIPKAKLHSLTWSFSCFAPRDDQMS